jgi:hypothetical protein
MIYVYAVTVAGKRFDYVNNLAFFTGDEDGFEEARLLGHPPCPQHQEWHRRECRLRGRRGYRPSLNELPSVGVNT